MPCEEISPSTRSVSTVPTGSENIDEAASNHIQADASTSDEKGVHEPDGLISNFAGVETALLNLEDNKESRDSVGLNTATDIGRNAEVTMITANPQNDSRLRYDRSQESDADGNEFSQLHLKKQRKPESLEIRNADPYKLRSRFVDTQVPQRIPRLRDSEAEPEPGRERTSPAPFPRSVAAASRAAGCGEKASKSRLLLHFAPKAPRRRSAPPRHLRRGG